LSDDHPPTHSAHHDRGCRIRRVFRRRADDDDAASNSTLHDDDDAATNSTLHDDDDGSARIARAVARRVGGGTFFDDPTHNPTNYNNHCRTR